MNRQKIQVQTLALIAMAAASGAAAQHEPLFSVANNGPSNLPGDAVFRVIGGSPVQVGGRVGMGLGRPDDDITALAPLVTPGLRATGDFVICFSVDPFAVGVSRFRITLQNLFKQALNNQQAGDAYLSTEALRRGVGVLPPPFSMGLDNNALAVNQSERYPNAFGLLPNADPAQPVTPGTPLDDVDATTGFTDLTPPVVYFTLSADSPSLEFLPGPVSGAAIFLDTNFQTPGSEDLFAGPNLLGLDLLDQIDGLIVLDDNLDGSFNGTDTVYVSLAPGSPTLAALGATPGDVLVLEAGNVAIFAPALVFGLATTDNMNALDMVPLINGSAEDTINFIVDCPADFNDDSNINSLDVLTFLNAWNDEDPRADFNGDGLFTTLDVLIFLGFWAGGC